MEHEYEKKLEVCRSQYEQQLTDAQNHLQQNMEVYNFVIFLNFIFNYNFI